MRNTRGRPGRRGGGRRGRETLRGRNQVRSVPAWREENACLSLTNMARPYPISMSLADLSPLSRDTRPTLACHPRVFRWRNEAAATRRITPSYLAHSCLSAMRVIFKRERDTGAFTRQVFGEASCRTAIVITCRESFRIQREVCTKLASNRESRRKERREKLVSALSNHRANLSFRVNE